MALSDDLLEILRCPKERTPLKLAEAALVEGLNAKIAEGGVTNVEGSAVTDAVDALLVREDGRVAYVVREDIPVMLIGEGIELAALGLEVAGS